MKLLLTRTYYPRGTNGTLYAGEQILCRTIELPWRKNESGISCIPEGKYEVVLRHSKQHGEHLYLPDVESRSLILIHPANNALKELRGCIAPVTTHTGEGTGTGSRKPFERLVDLVGAALTSGETVMLEIVKAI